MMGCYMLAHRLKELESTVKQSYVGLCGNHPITPHC